MVSRKFKWVSAKAKSELESLRNLQSRMAEYYSGKNSYYEDISFNENIWADQTQPIHQEITNLLAKSTAILEVGCGKAKVLQAHPELISKYHGVDFAKEMMNENGIEFVGAKFKHFEDPLVFPIDDDSFDIVFSHFVIEHTVFPHLFLDECNRVLKKGGVLIILCPDFLGYNGITSQRVGLSQGSGRDKIKKGKFLDALLTGYDSKFRLPAFCEKIRKSAVKSPVFMINLEPTCFIDNFQPDVDAVYVTYSEEMKKHLGETYEWQPLSGQIDEHRKQRRLIYLKGVKK